MPTAERSRALEELSCGTFDLLVIGAGIVGARVAYEAARARMRVALVDSGDFGGATSGASSKLVHGGFRYLSTWSLGLVREAQRERAVLSRSVAPHLVRPLPLLVVVERQHARRAGRLAAGVCLYTALTGLRGPSPKPVAPHRTTALVPPLDTGAVAACALLPEMQTHDTRLTLATVEAAARAGATVLNHVRVVALEQGRGRVSGAVLAGEPGEGLIALRCRAVVNATGPWVDRLRKLEDPRGGPLVRLSKGVHALLELEDEWRAGLAVFDEGRSVFAVPWQGMLMLGATDTPYDGDPEAVAPTASDLAALLGSLAGLLPGGVLAPSRLRSTFAGLRVLPLGNCSTASAPRTHVVAVGPAGMVSVAGGKLTTHRLIAVDALRRLPVEVRPRGSGPSGDPLPGAGPPPVPPVGLDRRTWAHLVGLYGSETERILEYGLADPDAFEPIHPRGPDVWAQAYSAVEHERALTLDDVVRRRTTLDACGLATEGVRAALARRLCLSETVAAAAT